MQFEFLKLSLAGGHLRSPLQTLGVAIIASMLFACSSTPDEGDGTDEPLVAEEGFEPAPAAPEPTNLEVLPPTPATPPVAEQPVQAPTKAEQMAPEELKQAIAKDERSVFFDYNSYLVRSEYGSLLKKVTEEIGQRKPSAIRVEGNTDSRGSREYNLALSRKRAASVREALGTLGVPRNIISTVGYGKEKLLAPGNDEESHAINRRSDILYQGEY